MTCTRRGVVVLLTVLLVSAAGTDPAANLSVVHTRAGAGRTPLGSLPTAALRRLQIARARLVGRPRRLALGGEPAVAAEPEGPKVRYETVDTVQAVQRLVARARKARTVPEVRRTVDISSRWVSELSGASRRAPASSCYDPRPPRDDPRTLPALSSGPP